MHAECRVEHACQVSQIAINNADFVTRRVRALIKRREMGEIFSHLWSNKSFSLSMFTCDSYVLKTVMPSRISLRRALSHHDGDDVLLLETCSK